MGKIFIDTWAWFALADPGDADHMLAQLANDELLNAGNIYVTTNLVLAEAVTLIRYHLHHQAAVRFWRTAQQLIQIGALELIRVDALHEAAAWAIFEKYSDQDFSFVDCVSFAVMRTHQVTQAFTADRHFMVMGFDVVP